MFAKSRIIATFLLAALLIVGLASSLHAATVANALDFDGVNDSVTIATLTNVPLANTARTVEAWVKVPPTFTGYGMVFAYGGTAFLSRLSVGIQGGKVTVEANNSLPICISTHEQCFTRQEEQMYESPTLSLASDVWL